MKRFLRTIIILKYILRKTLNVAYTKCIFGTLK